MRFFLCIVLLLCTRLVFSQPAETEYGPGRYFHFTYKNDFFTGTDYYYTQALRFRYANPRLAKSPVSRALLGLKNADVKDHEVFLAQDGYTPTSIRKDFILVGDRPYSAALYVGQRKVSTNTTTRLVSTLTVGVIGPWALGGEEQRWIHKVTDNVEPKGWKFQIANDLLLNYAFKYDRLLFQKGFFDITAGANANLGTYLTQAGAQTGVKFGKIRPSFRRNPTADSPFELYAFGHANASLIAHNATLQGGVFNRKSVYTISHQDISRFIWNLQVGATLSVKSFTLSYAHTYIPPEFKGGRKHAWGNIDLRIWLK